MHAVQLTMLNLVLKEKKNAYAIYYDFIRHYIM